MTTPAKMDDDLGQLTERILNLTLEIIYLLTGEGYKVVKEMSGEPLTPSNSPTDTPPPSLKNEINSKKILEVTNKIIDLLTGETGSVADLNIVVKEEEEDEIDDDDDWVYIGYKHHFNNVRVKDLPPLTSPDGSRKRNLTHPRDSTLDDHNYLTIPQHDQCEIDTEIISEDNEEEETPAIGDLQSLKEGGTEAMLNDKETSSSDITDGSRKRNPSETSVDPWNIILEDHNYVKRNVEDELENDIEMNSEDYEETPMGDQLSENEIKEYIKEKQTTLRITIEQDHNVSITSISSCTSCEDNNEDDNDTTQLAPGIDASTPLLHLNVPEKLSDESKNNESFSCSECDDSFSDESCYSLHVKTHTGRTATREDHATPHRDQCEETEVDEEEEMPSTEEGHDDNENGTTQRSPGGDSSPQTPHQKPSVDKPASTKLTYRKIFSCPECENSFADTLSYILHMEMHSGLTVLHQDHTIPRYDQGENKINTQPEVKKEEVTAVKGGQESTNEAGITTTMTEGQTSLNKTPESGPDVPNTRTRRSTSYEDNRIKDDGATQHSAGGDSSTRSPCPTVAETLSIDVPKSVQPKSKKIFSCSECENSFTDKSSYILHKKTHSRKATLRSDRAIPRHDQCEKDTNVQSEVHEAEEMPTRGRQQKVGTKVTMKGKKSTLNITPEHDVPNTRSRRSASREENNSKDRDTTQRSSRADSSPRPSRPTVSEKLSTDNLKSDKKKNKKIISCPKCKKSFSNKLRYAVHMKRRCGPRRLQERAKEKEIRTEVNKEEVTPMRGGLRSMKNVEGTTALKVKRTLSVSPEHEHHIPNTRKRLRTSCPDSDLKDNDTAQHSPAVKFSTQPLRLDVPKNKDVVTSTRVGLKSMKDVAVMETKKVKKTSSNTTPEHGHDLPNTRRSLRTSHPDHNKKEDGTTQESPKRDCSAHPLLPTAPENKEVVISTRAGVKSMKDVAVMETKKEKKKSLDITPEHGHDLPNTRRSLRTSHPDHNKKEDGTTQESPKVDCSAHPLLPTAPENKEVVTSTRAGLKALKDVAVMETKKEKKNSLDITPEHGHDLPNTRRSLRTSHPDHNKKKDGTTQESPKVDCSAHPLLPTAPENKEVVTSVRAGLKAVKDVAVMETKKEKKKSLDITPEHGHDLPNTRRSLRTSHPDHNKKEDGTTQESPKVDHTAHPLLPTAPANKEVVTSTRAGLKSLKDVAVMETKKEKKNSLDITPEHGHDLPNTRRSLHTSHPDHNKKEDATTQQSPEVDCSAHPLLPTAPENKEVVTSMRAGLKSLKDVAVMEAKKEKMKSLDITQEHGHDLPNTRRSLRTSHPDHNKKEDATTQQSPEVDCSAHPLLPTAPENKEVVTSTRAGHKSMKEVAVMETKKEKKYSLDITPEHEHDLPNTRRSLRTSHPESSNKDNGSTRRPPEVDSSAPLLHPTLPENKEGVTPMRSSRQCMKEAGMTVTTKNKKSSITPENEHDVPITRSKHRPSHPDDKTRGNRTTQQSSGVLSTTQPSPSSVTRKEAEVTSLRGGRLHIHKIGIMERLKARKTSLTITPEHEHSASNTKKSLCTPCPDLNAKENGTTQQSLGPDMPAKPLHHPTMTEQFLDINKMFFSCSECGKSFTKKLYFAIHMRMHTVRRPFQEEGDVPQHDQCEKNTDKKEEVNVEEDQPTKSRQQSKMEVGTIATIKKKKTSLKIKPTRGHDILSLRRRSRSSFPDSRTENKGAAQSSPRMHSSPKPLRHAVPGQSSPRMHSTPKPSRHAVPAQSSPRMHSSPKSLRHAVPAQSSPRMHSSPKLLRPTLPKKRSIDKQERDKPKSKTACPECGKFFCSESYVAIHLRSHTGKRPYKCFKCGKSFTYNSSLLRHQRHHSEVRPHKCSLCEKCFKEKSALRQHLRSHTGERPYPCPECDQRFTQKEHLHRHVRVHRGETPFACKLCGKRFTRKDLLTSHEQRHVNERPYTCPECGNGFTNQFCLGRHMRLLHS